MKPERVRTCMHVSQASSNGLERERSREPCSIWRQRAKAECHETNDPSSLYSPEHARTYACEPFLVVLSPMYAYASPT
jgi:hypothetical protein